MDRRGHRGGQGAGGHVPLPAWVTSGRLPVLARSADPRRFGKRRRIPFAPDAGGLPPARLPDAVLGETFNHGTTLFETDEFVAPGRTWRSPRSAPRGIRSRTRCSTESSGRSMRPSARSRDSVIWQPKERFSYGADLASAMPAAQAGRWERGGALVARFQQTSMRLKYCLVPTVAAVRGMALGGRCEFILHCESNRRGPRVLHARAGRGRRRPAAGGWRSARDWRSARPRRSSAGRWAGGRTCPVPAHVSRRSRRQGRAERAGGEGIRLAPRRGCRRDAPTRSCSWRKRGQALADTGYRPPLAPRAIPVAGATGIATLTMVLRQPARQRLHLGLRFCDSRAGLRRRPSSRSASTSAGSSISSGRVHESPAPSENAGAGRAHACDRQAAA